MRILLLRTWLVNVGNGFIDMGAKAQIRAAFPDAEIIEKSGVATLAAHKKSRGQIAGAAKFTPDILQKAAKKVLGTGSNSDSEPTPIAYEKPFDMSDVLDVDLAVLPGCVLYRLGLDSTLATLRRLSERNIPIVFLGVGGGDYGKSTQRYVSTVLKEIEPEILISRDSTAYELYGDYAKQSHNGIDCAFFLDDAHNPPESDRPFIVSTFDKTTEPEFKTNARVVRPDHNPFEAPYQGHLARFYASRKMTKFLNQEDAFISDNLTDYLFLYANAKKTYSDRIHACVPALVYGKEAQFFYDTPRAKLFERVLDEDISKQPVSLDTDRIDTLKKEQISELSSIA